MSLPKIHGATSSSHNRENSQPMFDVPEEEDREFAMETTTNGNDKFTNSLHSMDVLPYPPIDPTDSVKNRINILEQMSDTQRSFNHITHDSFTNLNTNLLSTEDRLRELVAEVQKGFDEKLAVMKKEYDHRFELQAIENKRFLSHISSLKADSKLLRNKLQITMNKLKSLQREFGDPDLDFEEEANLLTTANFSVSGSVATLSRPNTTG